jgi:hypothetical protein
MLVATLLLLPALEVVAIPIGYACGSVVRAVGLALVLLVRLRGLPTGGART